MTIGAAIAFTSILTAQDTGSRPGAETLSLRASLERAALNNPRVQIAKKDQQIARMQQRQAKSLFFPRAGLNFDAIRYRQETTGLIPPEIGNVVLETPAAAGGGVQGADDLYIGRLNLVQTLYAGGKVNYTYRLSKANAKRAENAVRTIQNDVELDTARAFYGLVASKLVKTLVQDALVNVEKVVRQATAPHSKLAASSERYDLRRRLSAVEQEEKDLRFAYLKAMGLEYFSDVDVSGDLNARIQDVDLQTALVWAKQNRSELKETVLQEEVDALSVDLSLAERYPVFRLGGGVEVRNNEFPLNETNWNAVLDMNIPIFDGFSSPSRVRESRYRADQGRLRRSELEDSIDMEVRSAHSDLTHWKNELAARENELRELQAVEKPYVGPGRAVESLTDRLDFMRWRLNRNVEIVDARLQLCIANARLCRAMGRSIMDENQ